jgi:signal transduction histidine kinase
VETFEVIQSVLRQFDSRRQEARLGIAVTGDLDCLAYADRALVAQILYNLVSNAVKYAPVGSAIAITASATRGHVVIRVKDQGPGIALAYQERIFEKFYRVKDDYVYKLKGHGLGLYLSRYFASLIGASLTVASEPGHGAEFALTLKRHRAR